MAAPDILAPKTSAGPFFNKVTSDVFWVFGAKMTAIFGSLVIYAILARLLSPNDLGQYFILMSVAGFFGLILQLGLGTTTMRNVAKASGMRDFEAAKNAVRFAFRMVGFAALVLLIIWTLGLGQIVSTVFLEQDHSLIFGMAVFIWITLVALQKLFAEVFRGFQMIPLASIFDNALNTVCFALVLVVILLTASMAELNTVIFASIVTLTGCVIIAAILAHRKFDLLAPVIGNQTGVLIVALPILVTEIAVFANSYADIWIIAAILPAKDVAIYGIVFRIALFLLLPGAIINAVIAPKIVSLHSADKPDQLEQLLRNWATISAIPALAIMLLIVVFGQGFLVLVFGQSYAIGYPVLIIMCLGRGVNIVTGFCGPCLLLCGQQKIMMISTVVFVAIASVFAVFAAKEFGLIGVATCFAVSMALQNITHAMLAKTRVGATTWIDFGAVGNLKTCVAQTFNEETG